jgi:hypothetical protein
MLGERLPSLNDGPLFGVLDDCPAGALLDIGYDHVGMGLARAPGLEAPGDASCDQQSRAGRSVSRAALRCPQLSSVDAPNLR